jgi:hypothetical protein
MSRHNKVNRDRYTQRGRLTPDDAARELHKMRQAGSQHTWQPVKKDQLPRLESKPEPSDEGTETTEDSNAGETAPKAAKTGAARKSAAKPNSGKAKTAKAKTGKAKTGRTTAAKSAKSATKTSKPAKRQAVLARNVGGGNPKPKAAKRRKS